MEKRIFGNTNKLTSEIGLGTWQLGTKWGEPFNHSEALNVLNEAYKNGITFIDTADCYNGGASELAIGEFIKDKPNTFFITTKVGRRLKPHTAEMYTRENILECINDSRKRLGVSTLDCVLLHCPPSEVYKKKEIFDLLDELKLNGVINSYGVSIEKVSEGLEALKYNISAIEVVFNMFRLKPLDELFGEAKKRNVAIIARVPLASGLLTGKFNENTIFSEKDHRNYNRDGKSFDKGETFAGVDYNLGLEAVKELKKLFKTEDLTPIAIKWCLMHDAVSVVIPGASRASQVKGNAMASSLEPLTDYQMEQVNEIYNKYIRNSVHNNW